MALTTRCPHCGATFKVAAEQLRVRNGLVRCGVCASVFDGNASLLQGGAGDPEVPEVFRPRGHVLHASEGGPHGRTIGHEPDDDEDDLEREHEHVSEAGSGFARQQHSTLETDDGEGDGRDAGAPYVGTFRAERASTEDREPVWRDAADTDHADAVRGEARTRYVNDYHSGRRPPVFLDDGEQERVARRANLWGAGCVLLFVVLLGLITYTYRNQLAAAVPALRPALVAACGPLQCQVNYERRIERISIMSSALRAPPGGASAAGQGQTLMLTVVLRNRYNAPQHWPTLILDLKDIGDRVVVRRNLQPAQYLPADLASQPFGANAEQRITVPIAVRDLQVNGYQIDKFFP